MKVSDFKLAEYFIRGLCKTHGCPFVDIPIEFVTDTMTPAISNGKMLIAASERLSKTIFQIIAGYLQNIEKISGSKCELTNEERNLIINTTVSIVRDMTYSTKSFPEGMPKKAVKLTLDRDPFVWTMMRSIICPAFDKPVKNIKIIARRSAVMDGAKFLNKGDVPSTDDSIFPFVFSNLEIENVQARSAYLLYETIRAHEMDPRGIVHEMFSKQELWGKFFGLARAAFRNTDAINDFITTLSILADEMSSVDKRLIDDKKTASGKWTNKLGLWSQSQMGGGGQGSSQSENSHSPSSWWYLGLIEKLLEPARGADWSGYFTMKPFTDALYNKVEDEKKRRNMAELPLELLLRIQGDEFKSQPDLIIEGLLADNRVW